MSSGKDKVSAIKICKSSMEKSANKQQMKKGNVKAAANMLSKARGM